MPNGMGIPVEAVQNAITRGIRKTNADIPVGTMTNALTPGD
jgi:hypothetical protein